MGRVYSSADKALVCLSREHLEDEAALLLLPSWLHSPSPRIDSTSANILWESRPLSCSISKAAI
jgi:hypothetical protein